MGGHSPLCNHILVDSWWGVLSLQHTEGIRTAAKEPCVSASVNLLSSSLGWAIGNQSNLGCEWAVTPLSETTFRLTLGGRSSH